MKKHYNMTLDEGVVMKAKAISAPIPFSRFVESLLVKAISHHERDGKEISRKDTRPQVAIPAPSPKQAIPNIQKQPKKWYDGMPFRKGGKR